MNIELIGTLVACYLIGSIPFGWIFGRVKGIDIRHYGSGSIGTTNVKRVLGSKWGLLTMVTDTFKGFAAFLLAFHFVGDQRLALLGGLAAVLGHVFPCYIGWKGGKGVATTLGVLLALQPLTGFFAFSLWVMVVVATRYVSLASIIASIALMVMEWRTCPDLAIRYTITAACVLIVVMHHQNIRRLLRGEESKMGDKHESGLSGSPDKR